MNYYLLLSGADANYSSMISMLGRFFSIIFAFVFVLGLAYYSTKLLAKSKYNQSKSPNMKLIDSMSIGYQSIVQLVKVGNKYILLGVSKENVTFLAEVDENDLDLENKNSIEMNIPFEKYLKKFIGNKSDGDDRS